MPAIAEIDAHLARAETLAFAADVLLQQVQGGEGRVLAHAHELVNMAADEIGAVRRLVEGDRDV